MQPGSLSAELDAINTWQRLQRTQRNLKLLDTTRQLDTSLNTARQLDTSLNTARQLDTSLNTARQLDTVLNTTRQLDTILGRSFKVRQANLLLLNNSRRLDTILGRSRQFDAVLASSFKVRQADFLLNNSRQFDTIFNRSQLDAITGPAFRTGQLEALWGIDATLFGEVEAAAVAEAEEIGLYEYAQSVMDDLAEYEVPAREEIVTASTEEPRQRNVLVRYVRKDFEGGPIGTLGNVLLYYGIIRGIPNAPHDAERALDAIEYVLRHWCC